MDLYLRLSVDREGKDSLDRQESDLRQWAAREGLTVRMVWRDAGKSGFKKDAVRGQFDAAIKAVSSGEVGTLAVWKLDRLSRRGAGQVGLVLDAVEEAGGRLHFLRDSLDSTIPGHRMVIVMVSEQARSESANTSLRVRAKIAADAAKGIPKGGVRSFGWDTDGMTLRPEEADIIREALQDYLAGKRSMTRIAHDWTDGGYLTDGMRRSRKGRDGITRPAQPRWTATTVRNLLSRDRNAGVLIHNGVTMPESRIQPIVTPEQLEALRGMSRAGTPVGARAQSLLGGVLRCECGAPMHRTTASTARRGGRKYDYSIYKCREASYDRTRRHASIQQPIVDGLFLALLLTDFFHGRVTPPASASSGELRSITERLAANAEATAHVGGVLLDVGLRSLHMKARGELKVLDAERATLEIQRDAILARVDEASDLGAFIAEWRSEDGPDLSAPEDAEAWYARFHEVWRRVPVEHRQGLIRSRYRPVVRVGGRGVGRIQANPVDATTFAPVPGPFDD